MLQLSPRPLTASAADGDLFVDRDDELRRITRAVKLRLNTYVAGPPGSGRTSLLHRAEALLENDTWFVRAEGATDGTDVTGRLAAVAARHGVASDEHTWPPVALLGHPTSTPRRRVILVDGLADDVRHHLFGRYRDELWEARTLWIVTGSTPRLEPPEDAFFSSTVELGPLDEPAIEELLLRRAGNGKDADAKRVRGLAADLPDVLGPSTPRAALGAALAVLLAKDPDRALARLRRHADLAGDLPDTAEKLLDALLAFGPTHAGDPRLLDDLALTRTRAVQVLQSLKAKGLVTSVRHGRRILYDLAWRAA